MTDQSYTAPESLACPRCDAVATLRSGTRRIAGMGWQTDFDCPNGHRLELFSKPRHRGTEQSSPSEPVNRPHD